MVAFQQNEFKVLPVLDFCELNGHIDTYTSVRKSQKSEEGKAPTYQCLIFKGPI